MKNSNLKIFIIIFVLLGLGALVVAWQYQPKSIQNAENTNVSATPSPVDWKIFTHADFTLSYPPDFILQAGEGLGGEFLDTSLVKIRFPEGAFQYQKTNYSEAYFLVSRSADPQKIPGCTTFDDLMNPAGPETPAKTIHGVVFAGRTIADAAAGNLYTSRVYRTLHDNTCYEISLTVHTGNIYNYPEGTVTEFDKEQAYGKFEQIAETFYFTK